MVEREASGVLNREDDGIGKPGLGRVQAHLELNGRLAWGHSHSLLEGEPSQ